MALRSSPAVATNLYAALFTDTGGFRHENTTEAALRLAASLVAAGADPGWVALKSYKSRSIAQVRLEGLAVAQMHSEMNGRLLWSEVTAADAGAGWSRPCRMPRAIIDALQSIDTMEIAILFKQTAADRTKISVRTPRADSTPPRSARPSGVAATDAPPAPSFGDTLPTAERRVLEVARRLIDSAAVTGVAAPGRRPTPQGRRSRAEEACSRSNKPAGITSFDAVRQVRRILGERRVGHAGTLDPTATGLLPICVGRTTRFVDYFHAQPKTYHCVVRLGERSDTCDTEGVIVPGADASGLDARSGIRAVLARFTGEIDQIPPMHSAVRHEGRHLYELARARRGGGARSRAG